MEDHIFDTEEKKERALAILKDGLKTPFWKLMVDLLTGQIDVLKEQILSGVDPKGEKFAEKEMDGLRDQLRIYQDFIKTPQFHIDRFAKNVSQEPNLDPYFTSSDIKKEREKFK